MSKWVKGLNAVLATLVVAIGAGLVWAPLRSSMAFGLVLVLFVFFLWRGSTASELWAWATMLLGGESVAWPITTMVRVRASAQPSEEEMGLILNAVLFGLFSSVFWISFAVGLFRRAYGLAQSVPREPAIPDTSNKAHRSPDRNRHRS